MVEITDHRDEQRKRKSSQVNCNDIMGPSYSYLGTIGHQMQNNDLNEAHRECYVGNRDRCDTRRTL